MGVLDNIWRSSVDIMKDSVANLGVSAVRLQVDGARQALREGDADNPTTSRATSR